MKLESSEENVLILISATSMMRRLNGNRVMRRRTLEDTALGEDLTSSTPITEVTGDYTEPKITLHDTGHSGWSHTG